MDLKLGSLVIKMDGKESQHYQKPKSIIVLPKGRNCPDKLKSLSKAQFSYKAQQAEPIKAQVVKSSRISYCQNVRLHFSIHRKI